jgi:tRNA nucleotidyltransferase (CCA-adding enzyme)
MRRLKFSKKEIERVSTLVRWHMFYFPYDEEDFEKGKRIIRRKASIGKWTDAAIRRFVRNVGGEDAIDDLIKLRIADATANPKGSFDETEVMALQKRISEVREKDMALKVSDLDIKGEDLIKLGIKSGPKMGKILNELLEMVIEDPTLNDKERLVEVVKERYLK